MTNIANLLTEHMDIWTAADTEKKSGRGRASGNAGSVYGVKKLRELILELAVRGKLVPQDPNDEPASELLKRIQAEKEKLIVEGKLKKEKPLTAINKEEKPFELPIGWKWAELNEVAEVVRGVTYGKSDASDDPIDEHVPLLRGNNIDRILNFDKPVYVPRKLLNESQFIKKGDIVIAMSSGSADLVGKAAQAQIDFDGGFGAFCGVVRPYSKELFNYFSYFFQTPYYRKVVAGYGKGIGINNLQKSSLVLLNLPIPPLAEQYSIVEKVDELMVLCDQLEQQHSNAQEAHETLVSQLLGTLTLSQNAAEFTANWQRIYAHFDVLFTTEASIDALKQTLLQLAVMGKLVPQNPSDEPASELLKRIQAEKAKLIAEGKLKKEKPLSDIGEDQKPFELPKGWDWVSIQKVTMVITDGTHHTPNYLDSGIPFISVKDINGQTISFDDCKYISEKEHKEINARCNPEEDDILLCRIGTLGRPTIVDTSLAFSLFVSVGLLKLPKTVKIQKYLHRVLSSPMMYEQYDKIKAGGSHTNKLNLGDIPKLLIPIPPLEEQERIVTKVDALMALCDILKTHIKQANQQQNAIADMFVGSVIGTPFSTIKTTDKMDNKYMKIIAPLVTSDNANLDEVAMLANIINLAGGKLESKSVWQASKLELKDFYKQLKYEINAGYIVKPSVAIIEEDQ